MVPHGGVERLVIRQSVPSVKMFWEEELIISFLVPDVVMQVDQNLVDYFAYDFRITKRRDKKGKNNFKSR